MRPDNTTSGGWTSDWSKKQPLVRSRGRDVGGDVFQVGAEAAPAAASNAGGESRPCAVGLVRSYRGSREGLL